MTGSATDPLEWQPHIRNKSRREELARAVQGPGRPAQARDRARHVADRLRRAGLHTMYVDKPMQGHGLMQAIARVNRVFRDKPGGLVVDYLGLADDLRQALATYTESGGEGRTAVDQDEAVAVMLEKHEVCRALFHGFDYSGFVDGHRRRAARAPRRRRRSTCSRRRTARSGSLQAVVELSKAFALAVPREEALAIRDDVAFFQAVQGGAREDATDGRDTTAGGPRPRHPADRLGRDRSGRGHRHLRGGRPQKPDISILSDEFLAEVRELPQRNLAVELLQQAPERRDQDAVAARTSSRRGRSPRCSSGAASRTRTARSRRRR